MEKLILDTDLVQNVEAEIERVLPEIIRFRHERHKNPELTWQEHATAQAVAKALSDKLGIVPMEGVGRLGVVGLIEGDLPGPTIALRADMDALPIQETSGKSYSSCRSGVMHACGHDGHMANLLGSAMVLQKLKHRLRGRVKLIFQPAEEGGAGADHMCRDGVLSNPDVDVIFGLHGWPELPAGHLYLRPGAMLAATADFTIRIHGTGCHAATPHLGTDQVLIAARVIESLQSVRSRFVAPYEPLALSITRIHGGTANNIIPSMVELGGTLRTVDRQLQKKTIEHMRQLVEGLANLYGARAEIEICENYPATINHKGPTAFLQNVAEALLPANQVHTMEHPSMGGEDFAYFLQKVPGSYFFLGMDDGRKGGYPSLHHPDYDFNDAALRVGMKIFVHAALAYASYETEH